MVSEILGYISLMGFVAITIRAFWKGCRASWKGRKRAKNEFRLYDHGFDGMSEAVEWALLYCLNRGFIVTTDRETGHFIQFRKYILGTGERGLELGFPEAPWSKVYFPKLREALTADGIPFRETRESTGDVTAFIHVDCGQNVEMAVELARRCFFDLFQLAPDSRFKSTASNYSVLYDEVDDPDYENPSIFQFWSAFRARFREKGLPDPNLAMKGAAFAVGMICLYPALWVAWFTADRATPDWQWSIGSFYVAGSHATWILLLLFCVWVIEGRKTTREIYRASKTRPTPQIDEIIHRVAQPPALYGLPLAVIISWVGF